MRFSAFAHKASVAGWGAVRDFGCIGVLAEFCSLVDAVSDGLLGEMGESCVQKSHAVERHSGSGRKSV